MCEKGEGEGAGIRGGGGGKRPQGVGGRRAFPRSEQTTWGQGGAPTSKKRKWELNDGSVRRCVIFGQDLERVLKKWDCGSDV